MEWNLGGRIFFNGASLQPFLSGGLGFIQTEVKTQSSSAREQGIGIWFEGGFTWEFTPSLSLGSALKPEFRWAPKFSQENVVISMT